MNNLSAMYVWYHELSEIDKFNMMEQPEIKMLKTRKEKLKACLALISQQLICCNETISNGK